MEVGGGGRGLILHAGLVAEMSEGQGTNSQSHGHSLSA